MYRAQDVIRSTKTESWFEFWGFHGSDVSCRGLLGCDGI